MALTGYYKTLIRPRTHRPLSMLKYDPVGMSIFVSVLVVAIRVENRWGGDARSFVRENCFLVPVVFVLLFV